MTFYHFKNPPSLLRSTLCANAVRTYRYIVRWRDGYGFVLYVGNGQFYVPKSDVIQEYFSFFKVTLAFKKNI